MPIWKAPVIVAGAKKLGAAAAPLVTRAAQTLAKKITPPVVTPRAAQTVRAVEQLTRKAPVVTPKAAQPLVRAAQAAQRAAARPPVVTPKAAVHATAPIIRAAASAAKLTPVAAAGYGLARLTQPQTPPLVTQQTSQPRQGMGDLHQQAVPLVQPRTAQPSQVTQAAAPALGIAGGTQQQFGGGMIQPAAQFGQNVGAQPYTAVPLTTDSGGYFYTDEQPPVDQPPAAVDTQFTPDFNLLQTDLLATIDQTASQNAALAMQHTSQLMAAIDATEARIMEMFRQQGTALDPATLSALRSLRDGVETRRRQLTDEMNRRGLLQSGIWLEMEDRIHRGQLTAEEDLLGRRLSDIQNRMSGAMMDFAQQRLNIMGTGLREQRDIMRDAGQQGIAARQNIIDQQFDWTQWQQEQTARNAQWDRAYQQEERATAEARRRWEAEQAAENARFAEDTRRWGEEQALRLRDQRLQERRAAQAGAGTAGTTAQTGQPTQTERDRAAFSEAYSAVVTAVNAGTSPETIKSNIRARAADLIRDGVDVNELLQLVDTLHLQRIQTQAPAGQQNQPGWYTGLDQSLGGWLPWGAPRQ
ncbi:MAG: hypothetical protein KGZ54_11850 [Dethiobacter sp.]|nr:hypothetical protein [Dethiobacter sp.]MBS3902691.1 hypothetical protein [Dethiobacter sp.]MBS3989736.1 hypothetical protein [Dethiobacter sp.]